MRDKTGTTPTNPIAHHNSGFEQLLKYHKRYSDYNTSQISSLANRISRVYGIMKPCQENAYRIEDDLRSRDIKNSTIRHYLRTLELMAEYRGSDLDIKKTQTSLCRG